MSQPYEKGRDTDGSAVSETRFHPEVQDSVLPILVQQSVQLPGNVFAIRTGE